MRYRLLFSCLSLVLVSGLSYSQTWPPPGSNLSIQFPAVVVECYNDDLSLMEDNIWDLILDDNLEIFAAFGGCEHDITNISPIYNEPYSCVSGNGTGNNEITVEFFFTNCSTGAAGSEIYRIDITDTTPPFDNNSANCSYYGPFICEGNTLNGDPTLQEVFYTWVDEVRRNVDECFGDNCTFFEDLTIQMDPSTEPNLMDGSSCYDGELYTITFNVRDECGNVDEIDLEFEVEDGSDELSAPVVVEDLDGNRIPFGMNWTDEIFGGPVCPGQFTLGDAPVLIVSDVCQGTWIISVDEVLSDDSEDWRCFDGSGIWYYNIVDECGNEHELNPWEVKWDLEPEEDLQWADMSAFPPEGSCIEYRTNNADCNGDFINPISGECEGFWVDTNGDVTLFDSVLFLDQITGGCPPYSPTYSHLPCEFIVEQLDFTELVGHGEDVVTETFVRYTVSDACGAEITWEFKVTYTCSPETISLCESCADTDNPGSSCFLCSPEQLANGYKSYTPPCTDPACPVTGPVLCNTGVPNNMSWFSFQASTQNLDVIVDVSNCEPSPSGLIGVQAGVYEICNDWGNCIGGFETCTTNSETFGLTNLSIGAVYYMWVDGCGGSECDYTIRIQDVEEIFIDTPDAIRVTETCNNDCLTCDGGDPAWSAPVSSSCQEALEIRVFPGECLEFEPIHLGDQGYFPGYDNPCDGYSPAASIEYVWRWWNGTAEVNPHKNGGAFMETLCVPMNPGRYEICLEGIYTECTSYTERETCMTVIVTAPSAATEYFDVEEADLDIAINGPWLPPVSATWDGRPWVGPAITLDNVESWTPDLTNPSYLCNSYEVTNECSILVGIQTICIQVVNNIIDLDGDGVPADMDCDDTDPNNFPGNSEVCDEQDNNCNGQIDEGVIQTFYLDADQDGYGSATDQLTGCIAPTGYVANNTDCDDNDANNFPGNTETCDNRDNNCNGQIDEGLTLENYYMDADADGFGNPDILIEDCSQPMGYVSNNTDCDDNDANNYPGNVESCDERDNNCNGIIDEDVVVQTFYIDADGDGYGSLAESIEACSQPAGYASNSDDCDDSDDTAFPGNAEVCDDIDNNCNGQVDEGLAFTTYYLDADMDGYGNPLDIVSACSEPSGYVEDASDCNDSDPEINPAATEIPGNGIDEDCDGVDEPSATYELNNKTIEIFPNPVSNFLSVLSSGGRLYYNIYDLNGELIAEGKVEDDKIDMEYLSSSVYLLVIRTPNSEEHIMERIIKL